jgi:hypothetical protein
MRTRSKLLMASMAAAALLSYSVAGASANRLSVSNRLFRITWTNLKLQRPPETALVSCPVTLEGSFHSATIRKVTGDEIGSVTRGIVKGESCTGGTIVLLTEILPWPVSYEHFSGTLPAIVEFVMLFYGIALRATLFGMSCLYEEQENVEENISLDATRLANGALTSVTPLTNAELRLSVGGLFCPPEVVVMNPGQMFVLGSVNRITLTLI